MHVKKEEFKSFFFETKGKLLFDKRKENESKEKWVQEERQRIENQAMRRESASNYRKFWKKKKRTKKREQKGKIPHQKTQLCFCQTVKIKEKTISKDTTKNTRKQNEGSGYETTLIGVYAQVEVHTTQFSLHMQSGSSQRSPENSIKLSFSFWMVTKNNASRQGHWSPNGCTALFGTSTSTVAEHYKLRELVFPSQTAMHCVVFHLASLRVRFSIRALPSSHTSFQWICFHSKTFHLAPGNSKFFPLVSLDWFFAQALLDLSLSLVW